MCIYKYLLLICVVFSFKTYAQTGPGGVGDGTANLNLWLRADAGVESLPGTNATNGQDVSLWLDQSGGGNDASAVNAPNYATAQHNGYPAVYFKSADTEYMNFTGCANFPMGN